MAFFADLQNDGSVVTSMEGGRRNNERIKVVESSGKNIANLNKDRINTATNDAPVTTAFLAIDATLKQLIKLEQNNTKVILIQFHRFHIILSRFHSFHDQES